jgi:hypothetical protein
MVLTAPAEALTAAPRVDDTSIDTQDRSVGTSANHAIAARLRHVVIVDRAKTRC